MQRFYDLLLRAFSAENGPARVYWCERAPAGAALTTQKRRWRTRQRMWLALNPTGRWRAGEELLAECRALNDEIEQNLVRSSRTRCQNMLYQVITTGLAMLDCYSSVNTDETKEGEVAGRSRMAFLRAIRDTLARASEIRNSTRRKQVRDAEYLESRLKTVQSSFELAAKGTLQSHYLAGMFAGIAVLAGTVMAIVLPDSATANLGWVAGGAGGAGAVVSTLIRMSDRRGLQLDVELGRWNALLLGVVRTILGFTFGAIVYLLIASQLVPLVAPDEAQRVAFYSAFAFAGGFSERLIPDTLGVLGSLVQSNVA